MGHQDKSHSQRNQVSLSVVCFSRVYRSTNLNLGHLEDGFCFSFVHFVFDGKEAGGHSAVKKLEALFLVSL